MRRLLLVATLLVTCAGPTWAWNDDAERCYKATISNSGIGGDEAIAACTRALGSADLTPIEQAKTFANRGVFYGRKSEYDRAIADFTEAIRLKPDYAWAFARRGETYLQKGEPGRAIADLDEAIRLDPEHAWALAHRGEAYRQKGEYDRAIADLDEAIRLQPGYALAFLTRGWAHDQRGDLEQAERDYRQALSLDPGLIAAKDSLDNLKKVAGFVAPPAPVLMTGSVSVPQAITALPAGRRVALVIGNGAYRDAPPLANPPNDARAVAAALRRLDFEVTEAVDLDRSAMEDALLAFARQAETADDALVFYAGHGIQVDGRNYLLPVDTRLEDERDLRRYLTADHVVVDAAGARRFALVILDACRDNPFTRSLARRMGKRAVAVGRGLAAPGVTPPNTLIAYATGADAVAADAIEAGGTASGNSPFTTALLQYLEQPGLEVGLLFRKVRDAVYEATDGQQVPFTYGSLGGDEIYLASARG